MSFPLGGTYHVPHGESNYMLFGAIMDYYDEHKPDGEIMKFKELVSSILGCEVKDAIPEMNALLQLNASCPCGPCGTAASLRRTSRPSPCPSRPTSGASATNASLPFDWDSGSPSQVLLKFFQTTKGEIWHAPSLLFFATRFLYRQCTFLCIFVQYTQKYNEIKNILWAFFLRLRIDFPKESRYNWKQHQRVVCFERSGTPWHCTRRLPSP